MGQLSGALKEFNGPPKIELPADIYDAHFIGFGDIYTRFNKFNSCRSCEGKQSDEKGRSCQACDGTGVLKQQMIPLLYVLDDNSEVREDCSYILSPARTTATGKTLSASTLYLRLRAITGIDDAKELDNDELYKNIHAPVRLVIEEKSNGNGVRITNVLGRKTNHPRKPANLPAAKKKHTAAPQDDLPPIGDEPGSYADDNDVPF